MPRSRSPDHKKHGSRSRSPKGRHGRSRSPKHGDHHGRSKSPKHGRDHHSRSKSPRRDHHSRSKSPHHHRKHSDGSSSSADDERRKYHVKKDDSVDELEEHVAATSLSSKPNSKPTYVKPVATQAVAAAVSAPAMGTATTAYSQAAKVEEEPKFFMTKIYGGEGGNAFDHMNRQRVEKISVRAGKFVDSIAVTYMNSQTLKEGGDGGEEQSLVLPEGEYVNEVDLTEGNVIQSITFTTNKGRKLGPCGSGRCGGLAFMKEGNVVHVKAPDGYRLVGICGRAGKWLDGIGFRWGPVPQRFR